MTAEKQAHTLILAHGKSLSEETYNHRFRPLFFCYHYLLQSGHLFRKIFPLLASTSKWKENHLISISTSLPSLKM